MPYAERQAAIRALEQARHSRVITFVNADRMTTPGNPQLPGLLTNLAPDTKPHLYRLLRDIGHVKKLDLFLYTRGGDVNAVWPLVTLLRDFTDHLTVLVPYRAHSAGTLVAFGGDRIVMGRMGELSPIDPMTANQFNPEGEQEGKKARLGISVEDVAAFFDLAQETLVGRPGGVTAEELGAVPPEDKLKAWELALTRLSTSVHPLALGNVERVHKQIKKLATELLSLHVKDAKRIEKIVEFFSQKFYSHQHAITRREAAALLGDLVEMPNDAEDEAMWNLMELYSGAIKLEEPFNITHWIGDDQRRQLDLVGGFLETVDRSQVHVTELRVTQVSALPGGMQIQPQPGQQVPLIPGLPRAVNAEMLQSLWRSNTQGV
jgi:Serine dehydrogenase proteinase